MRLAAPERISKTRASCVLAVVLALAQVAAADPNPKRKVAVLEYRASSSALQGIGGRVVGALRSQTSLDILGPDQARAVFGEHIEQVIVKCAGEADCIARIGIRIGAAEVILVGVSELGDVILTMQRVDVSTHAVSARVADSLAPGATPNDAQIAGYLSKLLPPSDFVRFGVIDIIASEAGAAVTVGGEARGSTPLPPLKLHAPATYELKVEKAGFVPFSAQVAVPPDAEIKVRASLQRPGGRVAWYQRWYVLTVAGIVVAGAAGTAIYYAGFRSSDRVPIIVSGP
jgi:hypothetical protein